jgi:hypothetical protein
LIVGRFCESRMLSGLTQTPYSPPRKICVHLCPSVSNLAT